MTAMKPGLVYALSVVIAILAVVILLQQRKLAMVRHDNDSLRGDVRTMITTRNTDAAASYDLQRELRQVRSENEQLRKELQDAKGTNVGGAPPR